MFPHPTVFASFVLDVCIPQPDEKCIMTYVSALHRAFPDMPPVHRKKVMSTQSRSGKMGLSLHTTSDTCMIWFPRSFVDVVSIVVWSLYMPGGTSFG